MWRRLFPRWRVARWYVGVPARRRRGGGREIWSKPERCLGRLRHDQLGGGAAEASAAAEHGRRVGSGENCDAYWLLNALVELGVIERTNRRLAVTLGADLRCGEPARILRPVGSLNWKRFPPAAVRMLRLDANERISVGEIERSLSTESQELVASTGLRRRSIVTGDPLAAIPPRVYFHRLTGQAVGRSGKTRCPFHEDRTPSLHVYEDPDRGWYCFGCGRGGSIYDLASLLWNRGTRGHEFIALRRALEAQMGSCW